MAKFCGKCGTRLNEATGLCPNCDIGNAGNKRKKQRGCSGKSLGQKMKQFILRFIMWLLIMMILTIGAVSLLVYFELIDIPVESEIMTELGIGKTKDQVDMPLPDSGDISFETSHNVETTLSMEDPAEVAYLEAQAYCADLEKQGEYISILRYLDSLMNQGNEDIRYSDLRSYYEKKLVENVLETVEAYVESGQYKSAAIAIMDAQEVYACNEFEELLKDCRKHLSIPLASCRKVEDSNPAGKTKDVGIGYWKDVFGTTHADSARFWVVEKSGWQNTEYIVYELNGSYTTLAGEIVSGSSSDAGSYATILIYLDDVLTYTSPEITLTTQPVQFEIDVSGVKQIRVVCTTDSSAFNYCIVDAVLSEI